MSTPSGKPSPKVRKSASFPFLVSAVCWIDLLGYGAMIADADFNPLHPQASQAMQRLRRFHEIVASHSHRLFPTLVMNDGAAAYRDLSLRSCSSTYDFLMRAWKLFKEINQAEFDHASPGARVVVATGFRMRGRRAGIDAAADHFSSLMRRYQEGIINVEQAIREAARITRYFDVIPQLQANFAFTKAYVAESSGKKGGLGGPTFFVDAEIFKSPIPAWVVRSETVKWQNERLKLKASFLAVRDFTSHQGIEGVRDGLEIAQRLSHDPHVLRALRAARKPSSS
jgi:hypothetical protein